MLCCSARQLVVRCLGRLLWQRVLVGPLCVWAFRSLCRQHVLRRRAGGIRAAALWILRRMKEFNLAGFTRVLGVWLEQYAISCEVLSTKHTAMQTVVTTFDRILLSESRCAIAQWQMLMSQSTWREQSICHSNGIAHHAALLQLYSWAHRQTQMQIMKIVQRWRVGAEDDEWALQMFNIGETHEVELRRCLTGASLVPHWCLTGALLRS